MARTIWKSRTWLSKLAWHLRDGTHSLSLENVLYPEAYFREKLVEERKRAERSNKAMVVMMVNAQMISELDTAEEITESVGEEVNACVRETDICGTFDEGVLIGVILTEIEPDKIEAAQQAVAKKTREKLAELLSEEMANQIEITFQVFTPSGGRLIRQTAAKAQTLTTAGMPDYREIADAYQSDSHSKENRR